MKRVIMRKLLAVALFLEIGLIAKSQNLTVEGTAPDLYITHTVAPKENFYSIARLYNQAPKSIASFNKITMEKGLTIGQQVKIPLNAQNFNGSENSNGSEATIPLTHIVSKSETLFKIGSDLNVPAESIRKWNNLHSDNIAPGTALIVGYLKAGDTQSSGSAIKSSTSSGSTGTLPEKKAETPETKQTAPETQKEEASVSVNSSPDKEKNQSQSKAEKQEESEQTPNELADSSAANLTKDTALAVVPEDTKEHSKAAGASAEEGRVKQQETSSVKSDKNEIAEQGTGKTARPATGTFADIYASQASQKSENTKNGQAATFKSTSGWQDKKYYVLINDLTPGTIVKVSSPDNKKAVFAKVLGSMPEMKENNGLLVRISNAAASDLGIIDPKFPVRISYYQ